MTSFGYRFGHPFTSSHGGPARSSLVPWPFLVGIGGHVFPVDLKHYSYETIQPFRTARDFDASPGEHSLNPEGTWKRNRDDWRDGAGQARADGSLNAQNVVSAIDTRFFASKGVDWTVDRQLSLLPDTTLVRAGAGLNQRILAVGGKVYVLDGTTLAMTANPSADVPTWHTATLAHTPLDMTTDGALVYVATSAANPIYSTPVGDTSVTLTPMGAGAATLGAETLAYCNGFLMAGAGPKLTGVAADGTLVGSWTHPIATGHWVAIVGAPNAIYALFASTDRCSLYRLGLDTTTGGLTVPVPAGDLPAGETGQALHYYGSRLVVGLANGVRLGEIAGDGSVGLGPRLVTGSCRSIASWGELTAFGWDNYDSISTGTGVLRLSDFIDANQPAYSSWLMATDHGGVSSVAYVNGDLWFCVLGSGVYRPSANKVPQGWLDQGSFNFGVHEMKVWSSVEIVTAPLTGTVAVAMTQDNGDVVSVGQLVTQGATNQAVQLAIGARSGEQASLLLTLKRSATDPTQGPVIRRYTFRALPIPLMVDSWNIPLILKTHVIVEVGDTKITKKIDVEEELDFLRHLQATGQPVYLQLGTRQRLVTVRHITLPEGEAKRPDPPRTAIEGIHVVQCESVFAA